MAIDLDEYLRIKDKKGLSAFIFLLGNEYSHLDNESSWIHYSPYDIQVVRLQHSEFQMMDIGIHPKIIIYKDGREAEELRGIPSIEALKSRLHKRQKQPKRKKV